MSTLFDQQLRKQQETNYETPNNTETREEEEPDEDPLARLRELARRQEALQRAQHRGLALDLHPDEPRSAGVASVTVNGHSATACWGRARRAARRRAG